VVQCLQLKRTDKQRLTEEDGGFDMRKNGGVLLLVVVWTSSAWATLDISPSFLGMYRKTMTIEKELLTHTARYGVDPRLARAVVLQESGGNAHLVSSAGARGYFQVMPSTFRMLKVRTNVEAGVKYLAQMQQQFGREDYAIAAYNAGPGAISKDRPLRLETLQYVINVGHYKSVLRLYEPEVRRQAKTLKLRKVREGESWETLTRTTGVPSALLCLYNSFLAPHPLRAGSFVAYPTSVPVDLLESDEENIYYTSRIGDSYLNLALVFGVDLETFRRHNDLWRLQQLPVGVRLRVAAPQDSPFRTLQLASTTRSEQNRSVEKRPESTSQQPLPSERSQTYTVRKGDTLGQIARRHRTTVQALQQANNLRNSHIRAGATLLIPADDSHQDLPTQITVPPKVFIYKVRRESAPRRHLGDHRAQASHNRANLDASQRPTQHRYPGRLFTPYSREYLSLRCVEKSGLPYRFFSAA
jgi:LysM repeat protein